MESEEDEIVLGQVALSSIVNQSAALLSPRRSAHLVLSPAASQEAPTIAADP